MTQESDNQKDTSAEEESSFVRRSFRWLGYGIELVGVMALFTYAGWWLDNQWDTAPWMMLTLMLASFIGMMYLLFKDTAQWRR